jgi:hypothetical protein
MISQKKKKKNCKHRNNQHLHNIKNNNDEGTSLMKDSDFMLKFRSTSSSSYLYIN